MHKLNTTLFDHTNRIDRSSALKFRCRLVSDKPVDVHREFTGCYFPRWRALYLNEVRTVLGQPKLIAAFPMDTYCRSGTEDHFMAGDFQVGSKLKLDEVPTSQRDDTVREFVITHVDTSRLLDDLLTLTRGSQAGARFGLANRVVDSILKLRNACIEMCGGVAEFGIKKFAGFFRQDISPDGIRVVTRSALSNAITECSAALSASDIESILAAFPCVGQDQIRFDDFMEVVRGPMSLSRVKCIQDIFRGLDFDHDGYITTNEVRAKFVPSSHPDVREGVISADHFLTVFLEIWDARGPAAKISYAEFFDYYSGVSAIVEDDDTFEKAVRASWKIRC